MEKIKSTKGYKMSLTVLKKLKKFVDLNGFAKTAYLLGYRDTDAIKKWFVKGEIPKRKIEIVKELLQ